MLRPGCATCAATAGWVSVAGNISLAIAKWVAGIACNSQALVADALHSTVDVLGSCITLVMLRLSKRPPSDRFPYGLGKLEDVAALAIYMILVVAGSYIILDAAHSVLLEERTIPEYPALLAALLSIFINLFMYYFISCAGRQNRSPSLLALGYENKVDALSSVAAFIGILGGVAGAPILDSLAAIVVSGIIIVESLRELKETATKLTDGALPRSVRAEVHRVARGVPYVRSILASKTRRLGATAHLDLDIVVDAEISALAAKEVAEQVADRIRMTISDIDSVRVIPHPSGENDSIESRRLLELFTVMKELRTRRTTTGGA